MLTAAQVAAKWARNASTAQDSMKAGVMAVTVAPTAKAAQNLQAYQNGVNAAVSSGRMAAALNAVTLNDWQQAMITKGIARVPQGVQAAQPKMQAFMDSWLPYQQQLKAQIDRMPKGSVADSQARSNFAIAFNAAYSKRLPGSG